MPTHWESSKRPLFIRTVLVNGSRHAILTPEDPLLPNNQTNKGRPSSARSSDSNDSEKPDLQQEDQQEECLRPKDKKRNPCDLQACIVRLRLVLAEKRKAAHNSGPVSQPVDTGNKKRKRTLKSNNRKKSCDWHQQSQDGFSNSNETAETSQAKVEYDNSHNITVATFFSETDNSYQRQISLDEDIDCIKGNCHTYIPVEVPEAINRPSTLNVISDFDVPWNTISSENYFTRPFYNRLSERVLQWLDLASKRKDNQINPNNGKKSESSKPKQPTTSRSETIRPKRDTSEDNSDEVKSEEDVDTVLSMECPKFTEELNRLHYLKSEIPTKYQPYTSQLQESIAQSFTTVVSIRSGKYAQKSKPPTPKKTSEKRGKLVRQKKLEESSEEECNDVGKHAGEIRRSGFFNRNSIFGKSLEGRVLLSKQDIPDPHPLSHLTPQLQSRIPWLRDTHRGPFWPSERSIGKPQLHIFIPDVAAENEEFSEGDSLSSDIEP